MTAEQIMQKDKECICGTYARFTVVLDHGKGAVCWDVNGKEYIDFTSGIGVNSLGFCYEPWVQAIAKQAATLGHTSNLFFTEPQTEAARILREKTGCSKTLFCNSGAEANEAAIKAARKYGLENRGGCEIITFYSGFHGRTMGALAATPQEAYQKPFGPMLDGFTYVDPGDFKAFQKAVKKTTCAVMLELVQGEGGVRNLKKEFVQEIKSFCNERDILIVVDEVQTGVGRTGTFLACEQYGLRPDIVTLAKGLGGGLPVGAVLFSDKCANVLQPGNHGTTFGGNPIVMAGALAVLKTMTPEFLANVGKNGAKLKKEISASSAVESVSGLGMMVGVQLKQPENQKRVMEICREKGLLVLSAKDRIRLLPPLNIGTDELEKGIALLLQALEEAEEK